MTNYPTTWQNFSDTLLTKSSCWMKMVGFHCALLSPDSIAQQPRRQRQWSNPTVVMMTGDWARDLRCTSQAHACGFEPLTGRITGIVLRRLSEGLSEALLLHSSDRAGWPCIAVAQQWATTSPHQLC